MYPNHQLITQLDRPLPLTGVNPRSIMKPSDWLKLKKKSYQKFDFHCECCGVHKEDAKWHKWLEAHEAYKCDYAIGKCELLAVQPLCYSCHHFIHRARLKRLCHLRQIPSEVYLAVIEHGINICKKYGLVPLREPEIQADWAEWRLIWNGKMYPPLFKNKTEMLAYQEWLASIKQEGSTELLSLFREHFKFNTVV